VTLGMELIPLLLMAPLLIWAGWSDATRMRIPNLISGLAILLFLLCLPLLSWDEVGLRLIAALVVLIVGILTFALNLFGGGDVKLLGALTLFVPSISWALFALVFALSMLLAIGFVLLVRAAPWLKGSQWIVIRSPGTLPMGIAIALAGLAHPFVLNAIG